MNITLHHLPNSRSQRILWLLEELSLNYDLIIYSKNTADKPNGQMKFPTLHIQQNSQSQTLTESSAVAEYLCQLEQKIMVQPADSSYWHFCFYKNFADAGFMPNLALKQVFTQIAQQTPWPVRFVSLAFKAAFNQGYLNPELEKQLQMWSAICSKILGWQETSSAWPIFCYGFRCRLAHMPIRNFRITLL